MAAIKAFQSNLLRVAAERGFWLKPLGFLDGYITWLVMTRNPSLESIGLKLLIVAGVHGEEQAGPLAILKWLQDSSDIALAKANVSFIPIVNSYGFANKKRYGLSGQPTNGGFGSHKTQDPSPEGQILVNNLGILRPLADGGFMSLHEDITVKESYLYTLENETEPSQFTKGLRKELSKYFPKVYDGIAYISPLETTGPMCKKGLVYNFFDDSFEALMFQLGVPRCAVPETPGLVPLKKRIEAQVAMINKFIELCVKENEYGNLEK